MNRDKMIKFIVEERMVSYDSDTKENLLKKLMYDGLNELDDSTLQGQYEHSLEHHSDNVIRELRKKVNELVSFLDINGDDCTEHMYSALSDYLSRTSEFER